MRSPPRIPSRGVAAFCAALAVGAAAPDARCQGRVLPLDPLTPAERQLAERVAQGDSAVRRLLGGRQADVAFLEMLAVKFDPPVQQAEAPDVQGRHAEVVFSVSGAPHYGVRVVVDLVAARVRSAERIESRADSAAGAPAGIAVPFSPREVAEARRLVLAAPQARELLGANAAALETSFLGVVAGDPQDPCFRNRCLEVLFSRGRDFLATTATVDLTTGGVRFHGGAR